MSIKPDLPLTAIMDQVSAYLRDHLPAIIAIAESDNPLLSTMAAYTLAHLTTETAFLTLDTDADEERLHEGIDAACGEAEA